MLRRALVAAALALFAGGAFPVRAAEIGADYGAFVYQTLPNLGFTGPEADLVDNLIHLYETDPAYAQDVFSSFDIGSRRGLLERGYERLDDGDQARLSRALKQAVILRITIENATAWRIIDESDAISDPARIHRNARDGRRLIAPGSKVAPLLYPAFRKSLEALAPILEKKDRESQRLALDQMARALFPERILEGNEAAKSDRPLYSLERKLGTRGRWLPPIFSNIKSVEFHKAEGRRRILVKVYDDSPRKLEKIPLEFSKIDIVVQKHSDGPIIGLNGERKAAAIHREFISLLDRGMRQLHWRLELTEEDRKRQAANKDYQALLRLWNDIEASDRRPTIEQARTLESLLMIFERAAVRRYRGEPNAPLFDQLHKILDYYAAVP